MADLRMNDTLVARLRCPRCGHEPLRVTAVELTCQNPTCLATYPIIDGCPILINDENSIFRISDFIEQRKTTGQVHREFKEPKRWTTRAKRAIGRLIPDISYPVADYSLRQALDATQQQRSDRPRILIIGAGDRQVEIREAGEIIYSDVDLGPITHLICDAHDIPFQPETFDVVIADSVLEHVADPARCVHEIYRVLRPRGLVYAVSPFMMQVHMGPYDFTRFTHLGHRRLFRWFDEVASGVACGPGMALAWTFERFIASFARGPRGYAVLRSLARPFIFFVKYFDRMIARRPGAYDNAAAYYFCGTKSEKPLSDRDLVKGYRGLIR